MLVWKGVVISCRNAVDVLYSPSKVGEFYASNPCGDSSTSMLGWWVQFLRLFLINIIILFQYSDISSLVFCMVSILSQINNCFNLSFKLLGTVFVVCLRSLASPSPSNSTAFSTLEQDLSNFLSFCFFLSSFFLSFGTSKSTKWRVLFFYGIFEWDCFSWTCLCNPFLSESHG